MNANEQVAALRRMTVANGCTEAEADTAARKLKCLLARENDLTPEDKLRFEELKQRYSQRVEAFKRDVAAIEEEMPRLLRRYPERRRDKRKKIDIDSPMMRTFPMIFQQEEFMTEVDKTCAHYKFEQRWKRWKQEEFAKLHLDWMALERVERRVFERQE
jgi:hypothetical protein